MNLQNRFDYFYGLYDHRNYNYLKFLNRRIDFLVVGINDLRELMRIDVFPNIRKEIYGIALSRIFTRIACVADYFKSVQPLNISELLSSKFPTDRCGYCGYSPCKCNSKFGKFKLASPNQAQLDYTITDWQHYFLLMYGHINRNKDIYEILGRLTGEAVEIISLQLGYDEEFRDVLRKGQLINVELHKDFTLEICDTFAWLMAVANKLDVYLEDAIDKRFKNGCHTCHEYPCICEKFNFKPVDWKQIIINHSKKSQT